MRKDTGKFRSDGKTKMRRKQLLEELTKKREYRKFRDQTLDGTLWRPGSGRNYLPVTEGSRDE